MLYGRLGWLLVCFLKHAIYSLLRAHNHGLLELTVGEQPATLQTTTSSWYYGSRILFSSRILSTGCSSLDTQGFRLLHCYYNQHGPAKVVLLATFLMLSLSIFFIMYVFYRLSADQAQINHFPSENCICLPTIGLWCVPVSHNTIVRYHSGIWLLQFTIDDHNQRHHCLPSDVLFMFILTALELYSKMWHFSTTILQHSAPSYYNNLYSLELNQ